MRKIQQSIILLAAGLLAVACSTSKNTPGTRFYHGLTARFNTLYNGQIAFNEALEAQRKEHKDDYTRLLPMNIQTNKATAQLGNSGYQTAITKSEKAIKLHSIKRRPAQNRNKRPTPKQKEYLQRKEFNPYLKNAWLLMAEAQFNRGEFIEAAATYNYILRLYATQPEVYSVAKAWLARCYVALDWPYDAEDLLDKMRRDSVTTQGARERDASQAALLIATEQYAQAAPLVRQAVRHTHNRLQRARLNFLAGQLYMELGDHANAYKQFSRVIRSNPPYELEFNARILQTEVMPRTQYRTLIRKLQRMAKSDKNKDYLDKVHYAIGNIHLSMGDTLQGIWAYEKGVELSTQNGIAKAVLLLRLSQIYWQRENYIDAQRTYQECIAILDKEHEEYPESERRSKVLDEVAPHLQTVKLQDSLQALARMPADQRLAVIDRIIEALKKKEAEEARKAGAEAAASNAGTQTGQGSTSSHRPTGRAARGAWYFYNPTTVSNGRQEFVRRWGNRPNEDNWRRSDKRTSLSADTPGYDYAAADSLAQAGGQAEEERAVNDSLAQDPHQREYYLAQIPLTDEQMEASNGLLADGLYQGGTGVMEKIQNYPYALRLLLRLLNDFPDFDPDSKAEAYYHLFLLYGRMDSPDEAEKYRNLLTETYPGNRRAQLLANPNYAELARRGRHIEDSLYAATYAAYQADRYEEVGRNFAAHTRDFPQGRHRGRILFVQAMSQLYSGNRTEFLALLEELIKNYGQEEIAEMASAIVKGIQEGRLLSDSKYGSNDIWTRRRTPGLGAAADSTQTDTLTADRFTTFNFVLAYPTKGLNEDQLLYEIARYNFTSYMVRNFEIEILDDGGLSLLCVKGFLAYDEVHAYAQRLYADPHMARLLQGIRTLLISDANLKLIGTSVSFDEYEEFYDRHLAPVTLPKEVLIDEPTDIRTEDEDTAPAAPPAEQPQEDDFPYGF